MCRLTILLTVPAYIAVLAHLARAADCSKTSIGQPALSDPYALVRMARDAGGLYPNGNVRPAAHEEAARAASALVRPRTTAGVPDPDGRIALLAIGMSNTTQEFAAFVRAARADSERNPALVLVDGAQGGWSADRLVASPGSYWEEVSRRLAAASVSEAQVQAAWMKQADAQPDLPFPQDAQKLASELETIASTLRNRFPNLRLLYLSSRIYAGYATTRLNPEPFAWQSAFAVKSLIERQLNGQLDPQRFPWIGWGPYLWADGTSAREDGLTWACPDFADDGTHPSPSGENKVARMLLDFFKTDTAARPWFVRSSPGARPEIRQLLNGASSVPRLSPGAIGSIYGVSLASRVEQALSLPLPLTLGGAVVRIGGRPVPLYYASPGQINFLVHGEPSGNEIQVESAGQFSESVALTLQPQAPGIFTAGGNPEGPAAAIHADGSVVSAARPARPLEILSLFFTGLGVRNPLVLAPEMLPAVRIGDVVARVDYYGPAPGFPGLNQLNVEVPADVGAGDRVPVVMQLASQASNRATLAVAR